MNEKKEAFFQITWMSVYNIVLNEKRPDRYVEKLMIGYFNTFFKMLDDEDRDEMMFYFIRNIDFFESRPQHFKQIVSAVHQYCDSRDIDIDYESSLLNTQDIFDNIGWEY